MTASERGNSPDFFEPDELDPFRTAAGKGPAAKTIPKKKAGFYLPESLLERFNRRYHKMKLADLPVENKSALLEIALTFALNDLDKDGDSKILRNIRKRQE